MLRTHKLGRQNLELFPVDTHKAYILLTLSAVPDTFRYVPIHVPKPSFGYHESIGYGQLGGESLPLRLVPVIK
jgi:hypothetical protein